MPSLPDMTTPDVAELARAAARSAPSRTTAARSAMTKPGVRSAMSPRFKSTDGTPRVLARVREQLPNDIKALGRALRDRGIGTLEIKKRGVDIDPAVLRTKLKPSGAESATLFVTRIGNTRTTLLADRV